MKKPPQKTILFVNDGPPDKPAMAAACVNCREDGETLALVAASGDKPVNSLTSLVMREEGIAWPEKILPVDQVSPFQYDLVICFCEEEKSLYPALPGIPSLINWHIPDCPSDTGTENDLHLYRTLFHRIHQLTDDLFQQGYLNALTQARLNAERVLDNLSEGVIAHDLKRKFFLFNKAAEIITGYRREEVLGRDCHDAFPERFCASKCSFCDDMVVPFFPKAPYQLTIRSKKGEQKRVEIAVVPMRNSLGNPVGVVATMKDLTREFELARRLGKIEHFSGIISKDNRMQEVFQTIRELADSNVPVLVQGESGTGKELVAAAIHNEGGRSVKRFVTVNCGALPESLLESELFGHVKGAFTGAIRTKKGRFELADGGTIFLDEIGDITPGMQVKLLRVLQDGTFQPLGAEKPISVNIRVISATHKNLQEEIKKGNFREDLYYRLCVVPVQLPPLRERRNDIPLLARHFLKIGAEDEGREEPRLSSEVIQLLMDYDWPGNVRELQNIIRYLLVRCPDSLVETHHLPPDFLDKTSRRIHAVFSGKNREKLNSVAVRQALAETGGNKAEAARKLGVGRATLYRFFAKHT